MSRISLPLVLASSSPQRRAILERLGVSFTVRPSACEEIEHGDPAEVALENALRKARTVRQSPPAGAGAQADPAGAADPADAAAAADAAGDGEGELVLGCDTLVALSGAIYGKPAEERAARTTLQALSGATHEVVGGVALLSGAEERTAVARTKVTFRELSEGMLDWYLASGEWRGRAGGYAIQGAGAALVRSVEGDYENVVGLPVATLLDLCPELISACK